MQPLPPQPLQAESAKPAFPSAGFLRRLSTVEPLLVANALFFIAGLVLFTTDIYALLLHYSSLVPACLILLLLIVSVQAIREAPSAPLGVLVRRVWDVPLRFYVTVGSAVLFLSSFTAFKINIPAIIPFYADPWLADADSWLHGVDPWRIARGLPVVTSLVVHLFYSRLWFGVALGGMIYASLYSSKAEFRRLAWATFLAYLLLGVVAATLLSSVGPVFYDRFYSGGRFTDLSNALAADPYASVQRGFIEYLLHAFQSGNIEVGTGISAMPSIHVAIAVVTAWYLTSLGLRWAIAGWLFAGIILFGSIYTGWHYAVDGYVSAAVATLLWMVLSRAYRLPILPPRIKA